MMQTANVHGTFSEFWAYASWLATHAPHATTYHPYADYGLTTERFFEDGTAPFAAALRAHLHLAVGAPLNPTWPQLRDFVHATYREAKAPLPSSLSFEASPRHRKKGRTNMHTEELRSRWHTAED